MAAETAAALLSRAVEVDRALCRMPSASTGLIVAEEDLSTMTDAKFLTIEEVADRLQISKWTVQDHRRRGLLRGSRLGRRVRVSEDEFNAYVVRLQSVGSGEPVEAAAEHARTLDALAADIRALIDRGDLDEAIAAACRRGREGR